MNIIKVYGEARVQLGDKFYIIIAPEGVTIREEPDKSLGFMAGQAVMRLPHKGGGTGPF